MTTLCIAQDESADALLAKDPLALLLGMLLDQQIPMEKAFKGPQVLLERLGHLDATRIAAMDAEAFAAIMARPPAVHRFPGSMAGRVQALCAALVASYDGSAAALWQSAASGNELLERMQALPGFGEQKAKIFVALLGKQYGVTPRGWRTAAGNYGDKGSHRSVADVVDSTSLLQVRAFKQEAKRAARAAKP